MYQSPSRNNFLDILIDPTTSAIIASIALHALLGAGLPFFTQLEKAGKKPEPSTVKVVELSPSELQRIPQAPPIPTPQVLPPASQPIPPTSQSAPPPISPNTKTVPFSPIRVPLENVTPTPAPAQKPQQVIPQQQPKPPSFNSKVSIKPKPKSTQSSPVKPKPKPNQSSGSPDGNTKLSPTPLPSPEPTSEPSQKRKILTVPLPSSSSNTPDPDGGNTSSTTPTTGSSQSQSPSGSSSQTSTPTNSTSPSTSSTQSSVNSTGNITGGNYGGYTQAVTARTNNYIAKYPNIKPYLLRLLMLRYPPDTPCPRTKQPPFTILMVGFDRVPQGQDDNILGDNTSQPLDNKKSYFGDPQILNNPSLLDKSLTAGFAAATEAEKNRPEADKDLPVLYYYRVQFDPATCKN